MYVSVAAGLYSSAFVVMTPVAAPIAGTVKNKTVTTAAATVRMALLNVRICVPLSLVFGGETYYQVKGCANGELRLASAAVAVPHHGDREQQRRGCDQLAAHDDAVDVDGRTPVDVVAVDHEGACGPCVHTESAAGAGALALGALASTAARATLHPRGRDHRDPVLLVRIAKDAAHGHRVARLLDHPLHTRWVLHAGPPLPETSCKRARRGPERQVPRKR